MNDAQLISLVIALAVTLIATLTVVLFGKGAEQRYIKAEIAVIEGKITLSETKIEARLDRMETALLSRLA